MSKEGRKGKKSKQNPEQFKNINYQLLFHYNTTSTAYSNIFSNYQKCLYNWFSQSANPQNPYLHTPPLHPCCPAVQSNSILWIQCWKIQKRLGRNFFSPCQKASPRTSMNMVMRQDHKLQLTWLCFDLCRSFQKNPQESSPSYGKVKGDVPLFLQPKHLE